MRKSIFSPDDVAKTPTSGNWLDLETLARVEVTSEDPASPIENALGTATTTGWRASAKGPQTIRIHFDAPQKLSRIQIHIVDKSAERSQEFALSAETADGHREVARQQFSFSPNGATEETEDYTVNLNGVTTVELKIDPDRNHDPKQSQSYASLQSLRIG
jgi:hypothetical protein